MTTKAAIYIRVSRKHQAKDGSGLAEQQEKCEAYADQEKLEVMKVYTDPGVSGRELDRPGIQTALADAEEGEFIHLIMLDSSRLGREQDVNTVLRSSFARFGVTLHSVTEGGAFDPDSEAGMILPPIFDALAVIENKRRARKIRAGKLRSAAEKGGIQTGVRPLGYDLSKRDKEPTKLVIRDDEAEVVRQMFTMFNDDVPIPDIAKVVDLSPRRVKFILSSQTYAGTWEYGKVKTQKDGRRTKNKNGETIKVKVSAIVSKKIFRAAQVRIENLNRLYNRRAENDYLLRGQIYCGVCGTSYWCKAYPNDRLYYYHPTKSDKAKHDGIKHYRIEKLDIPVKQHIDLIRTAPDELLRDAEDRVARVDQLLTDRKAHIEDRLQQLIDKEAKALGAYSEGLTSKEALQVANNEISEERAELNAQIRNLDEEFAPAYLEAQNLADILREQSEIMDADDETELTWKEYSNLVEAYNVTVKITPQGALITLANHRSMVPLD